MKQLVVFDFDRTILDHDTDIAVVNLAGQDDLPQEIKNIFFRKNWSAFMQGLLNFVHEKGVDAQKIINLLKDLPSVPGMVALITELEKRKDTYDLIIISGSINIYIETWLKNHEIENCFVKLFANPAEIVDGRFKIFPYQNQEKCKLCVKNLCKGQILEEFIENQKKNGASYERILYIGDGNNDFCPVLQLESTDLVCARGNYALMELINEAKEGKSLDDSGETHVVKAEVFVWNMGEDIMEYLDIL